MWPKKHDISCQLNTQCFSVSENIGQELQKKKKKILKGRKWLDNFLDLESFFPLHSFYPTQNKHFDFFFLFSHGIPPLMTTA